jgi:hypothetical protein
VSALAALAAQSHRTAEVEGDAVVVAVAVAEAEGRVCQRAVAEVEARWAHLWALR